MTTITNPNKALWEKGDFTQIAATMRSSGEELVRRIGVAPGLAVLDLGCGDGTTAIPAAQAGANVRGVDIAANLVAAGQTRAEQLGLTNCSFEEGDASNLVGLDDASFDLVVTVFGAMFAPRPFDTAAEMVRVVKPGGRIVMGNWIPGDPTLVAQILRISGSYSPPPPEGFVSPVTWGVEEHIHERFKAAGVSSDRIACERDTYVFDFAGTPKEFVGLFRQYYGPTMNAFAAAEANGPRRRATGRAGGAVRRAEHQHVIGPHRHPGDLHPRHRDVLTASSRHPYETLKRTTRLRPQGQRNVSRSLPEPAGQCEPPAGSRCPRSSRRSSSAPPAGHRRSAVRPHADGRAAMSEFARPPSRTERAPKWLRGALTRVTPTYGERLTAGRMVGKEYVRAIGVFLTNDLAVVSSSSPAVIIETDAEYGSRALVKERS